MKKLLNLILMSVVSSPMVVALGCSSGGANQPYSLTGKSAEQTAVDHEQWRQRTMYTDEKGHYHPELAAQGRPVRYIPG
jgi:hypothetical protein